MHILSGKFKGRLIKMPKGIRPTQDKVRKALFDILGDIEGLSFLELFAGTGAVGIEAASRGAGEVVFVENERRCCQAIEKNLIQLNQKTEKPRNQKTILRLDVLKAVQNLAKDKKRFDIIFLDPPYYQGLAKKTLQMLSTYVILTPHGFLVVQHFKKDNLPPVAGDLALFKQSRYGDTLLSFYDRKFRKVS